MNISGSRYAEVLEIFAIMLFVLRFVGIGTAVIVILFTLAFVFGVIAA